MKNSRQFSFINDENGFTISLIHGEALLQKLSEIHNIGPNAIDFYQKSVLSSIQMINFLKAQESLGFYIDSEEPYYRFKIEFSSSGSLRTLLLPEEFEDFPQTLTGKCRIHKIIPNQEPYTSILEFKDHPLENLINEVMEKSYQTQSKNILSSSAPVSLMITKLPPSNVNKKIEDFKELTISEIEMKYQDLIQAALILPADKDEDYIQLFENKGCSFLGSKQIEFHCPCSRERMLDNLFTLGKDDREHLFETQKTIEIRCDYCNTVYEYEENEVIRDLH